MSARAGMAIGLFAIVTMGKGIEFRIGSELQPATLQR